MGEWTLNLNRPRREFQNDVNGWCTWEHAGTGEEGAEDRHEAREREPIIPEPAAPFAPPVVSADILALFLIYVLCFKTFYLFFITRFYCCC